MSNQRMAGDNNIFAKSQQMQEEMMRRHQSIKNVMDRQTSRDVAATQGRMIPFSSADILPMG
tara:strand:- start:1874 stop:2059 length:186 start_codon:yes stop_codon:yes gene_type:complete